MKLAWCTDIHVNFLKKEECEPFYDTLKESDGVLISGDISEAPSIAETMVHMADYIQKPIYYVLGNHDYYNGSVCDVRKSLYELNIENNNLNYLTDSTLISIGDDTIITGCDGWADTRYGHAFKSHVVLNDEVYIKDLSDHVIKWVYGTPGAVGHWDKRKELADKDAAHLKESVINFLNNVSVVKKVIILTHIPPFPEASKHRGVRSDDNYLPFYASKATGDALLDLAALYPDIQFLCLCGHTHGKAVFQARSNLLVKAGEAVYGFPRIQEMIEI